MKKVFTLSLLILTSFFAVAQNTETWVKEYPVLWQQDAAEYRALCYQAFNIAALRINEIPKRKLKKRKLAIITDLDETILDNSYSEAQQIKDGKSYSAESWKSWTDKSNATAVPGAVAFLQMAKAKGITIFYVSNRSVDDVNSTLINLRKLNLPDAKTENMLFYSTNSSKEERRQSILKDYEVVMLMGDNLNDFTAAFEKKSSDDRFAETDKVREEWGRKFIVLPNAMYGEWENAIYNYQRDLTPERKEEIRRATLKGH